MGQSIRRSEPYATRRRLARGTKVLAGAISTFGPERDPFWDDRCSMAVPPGSSPDSIRLPERARARASTHGGRALGRHKRRYDMGSTSSAEGYGVRMELGHVTLSDGRRVDTYVGGDPHGPAVLLQHGMPQCRLAAAHVEDGARAAGVRLLALSRPGFGHSSPATPSLASCGRDALEVAAALGAETFAVLGISFGAPFAAATAAVDPVRVTALGICVGIGPWRILDADDPDLAAEI